MKLAGIDIGNDSIKLVLDGVRDPLIVPNIVAPGFERHVLQEEDSPLKALDVIVYSPKLSKNNQRYFVGTLAMENEDSVELEETDNKAISDQSLVVALTALAYAAVASQSVTNVNYSSMVEAEYMIGTGLPVRSYSYYHKMFEDRLVGEHEVTFLSTPQMHNRKVKVAIRRAVVSIEGAAAVYHMATHDNLQVKDEELYNGCIGICEIGALTTDFPVVNKMSIDNQFSTGEQIGMATYLDPIIRDVEDQFGYRFPSRAKLAQRIRRGDYTIRRIGEGQSNMKPIADMYFSRAASKIIDLIKKRWKKYPDIQCFYVIGGGAAALKPYIIEAAGSIKLRFVEDSELLNVHGYLKMAKSKVSQNTFVQ
jgi:plasmid segregation protein ParM